MRANVCIVLLLLLFCTATAANLMHNNISNYLEYLENEQNIYKHLLLRIQQEQDYKTCLILGNRHGMLQQQLLEKMLQQQLQKPLLIYDENTAYRNILKFNKEMLVIVYFEQSHMSKVLENLIANLNGMTQARIIFICTTEVAVAMATYLLETLFRACQRHKLLNTIAMLHNFAITRNYYSYTQFPKFDIEQKDLFNMPKLRIFSSNMPNFYGRKIRTTASKVPMNVAVQINMAGGQRLLKYPIKLVQLLAYKLNATLQYSYIVQTDPLLFESDFLPLTRNGSMDIPSTPASPDKALSYDEYSYPFEMAKRCVMVPVGGRLNYPDFFMGFLNWFRMFQTALCALISASVLNLIRKAKSVMTGKDLPIRFVDFALNTHVLGGVLGFAYVFRSKPIPSERVMMTMIFCWGLIFCSAITSRITSFLNTPPSEQKPLTLSKLNTSHLHILISRKEYAALINNTQDEFYKYPHVFKVLESNEYFEIIKDGIDPRFIYPVTTSRWLGSATFKRMFTLTTMRPSRICFKPLIYLCFPLERNSIYKEPLKDLIIRACDMGLLQYWAEEAFDDLTSSEWMQPILTIPMGVRRVLPFRYFHLPWYILIFSYTLSIFFFGCELLYFHKVKHYEIRKQLKKSLRQWWRAIFKRPSNISVIRNKRN